MNAAVQNRWRMAALAAVASALFAAAGSPSGAPAAPPNVDAIFARWNHTTPGCAVAGAVDGAPILARAYGMADLEHDVPITPETIFEAGSVSKQFTAAAVLLLARDGKLSLDDPVRTYIPELPDYGAPLTIRHMLTHTSGLRDWGSVEAIAGWPRTSRVYTHAHVLDIVSRQRALNFPPGTKWSYSNTGFNLAAILVARVSGMSFSDFTARRMFQPLGMTHTSWRDDHTRVVKNRAIAYAERSDGFHTDMPFEDIYGNGGLLTTVGDLLRWNENFAKPVVGDRAFVEQQQQPGRYADGRPHRYAFGLEVGDYHGAREISHSGSTAGYHAFLTRFPEQHVSVAVLCNVDSSAATEYARAVAERLLAGRTTLTPPTPKPIDASLNGLYRNRTTGVPLFVGADKGGLRPTWSWTRMADGSLQVTDEMNNVDVYERVEPAHPDIRQLEALAGTYISDEIETSMRVAVEDGGLVIKRRPDTTIRLTPVYADAFSSRELSLVAFRRDASGRVTGFSVVEPRVWDLRFERVASAKATARQARLR